MHCSRNILHNLWLYRSEVTTRNVYKKGCTDSNTESGVRGDKIYGNTLILYCTHYIPSQHTLYSLTTHTIFPHNTHYIPSQHTLYSLTTHTIFPHNTHLSFIPLTINTSPLHKHHTFQTSPPQLNILTLNTHFTNGSLPSKVFSCICLHQWPLFKSHWVK